MSKLYCKEKLDKSSKYRFLKSYFHNNSPATYEDIECTIEQCDRNKNRSVGDLKMLLDGAFKTETPIDDVIVMLIKAEASKTVKALFCPNILNVVFFHKRRPYYYFAGPGFMAAPRRGAVGKDGYSYNQMLEIYKTKQNEQK